MTQSKKDEVIRLMSQMDIEMQEYVIDTLRHLKFAQNMLRKKADKDQDADLQKDPQ